MSSERPVLVIIADSLSYYGPKGGLPVDHPQIWPTLALAALGFGKAHHLAPQVGGALQVRDWYDEVADPEKHEG